MLRPASGPPPLDFRAGPHEVISTTGLDTDEEELFAERGLASSNQGKKNQNVWYL